MKKLLSASILCLGLTGSVTSYAQTSGGAYNPSPSSVAGFPLFVSNLFADSISSINSSGVVNPTFVTTGTPQPTGLATNGSGNVYVAAGAGTTFGITQFNSATGSVQAFTPNLPFSPQGLTFGPDGFLYATTNFSSVARIDPTTGAFVNTVASTTGTAGALYASGGLTFGPDGNIYVANLTNNVIAQVNPSNGAVTSFSLAGTSQPTALIFDHNTLLVSNNGGNTITGYLLAGNVFTPKLLIGNTGFDTTINGPEGITIGPDGNIYVANDASNVANTSNIDRITTTRDPVTGEITSLSPATVFATEAATLGANYIVFVPEPSTYAIFAVAGIALAFFGVRRRMTLRA